MAPGVSALPASVAPGSWIYSALKAVTISLTKRLRPEEGEVPEMLLYGECHCLRDHITV